MTLTVAKIASAKARGKPYKMTDSGGLYLLVALSGSKLWRWDYRFDGRRQTLARGRFPDVKLAEARKRRDEVRAAQGDGADPRQAYRDGEGAPGRPDGPTFAALAERWFQARKRRWCAGYATRIWNRIAEDILPLIGDRPPQEVSAKEILQALRSIEKRGSIETARRVRTYVENIYKFAFAEQTVDSNAAQGLVDALETPPPSKRSTILNEKGFNSDGIKRQLAHVDKD